MLGRVSLTARVRFLFLAATYVNDGGSCELKGTQGTAQCGAQIFSYLEQLEPVGAASVSASSVTLQSV